VFFHPVSIAEVDCKGNWLVRDGITIHPPKFLDIGIVT